MISSIAIAWQDFKDRLISVWLIVAFAVLSLVHYLSSNNYYQFFENGLFLILYLGFSYVVLTLYYFLKNKRIERIVDSKIGAGDILLMIVTGSCLEPNVVIVFFTTCFVLTLVYKWIFIKTKSLPLGGILATSFLLYNFGIEIFS